MAPNDNDVLTKRKSEFENFYKELIPVLVEFIELMGIKPAHEVLNHAEKYVPYLGQALENMAVADRDDRNWLLARMAYFLGEYFAQKYRGSWYVNEVYESRFFARYVVGQFEKISNQALMIDPFEIAQAYVDHVVPRKLEALILEVEAEILATKT